MSDEKKVPGTFALGVEVGFRAAIHVIQFSANNTTDEMLAKITLLAMAKTLEERADKIIKHLGQFPIEEETMK